MNDLGKRIFLYGVACLFSINFLQGSVIGSVCAWIILVIMIVAHCFAFLRETGQKYHNACLLIFYSVLMVWFGCELAYFVLGGLWSINLWLLLYLFLIRRKPYRIVFFETDDYYKWKNQEPLLIYHFFGFV